MKLEDYMTSMEAAVHLNLARVTTILLAKQGKIEAIKLESTWLLSRVSVEDYRRYLLEKRSLSLGNRLAALKQ